MYPVVSCIVSFLPFAFRMFLFRADCMAVHTYTYTYVFTCNTVSKMIITGDVCARIAYDETSSWSVEMYHRFRWANASDSLGGGRDWGRWRERNRRKKCSNKFITLDVSCATWPIFAPQVTQAPKKNERKKMKLQNIFSHLKLNYVFLPSHICCSLCLIVVLLVVWFHQLDFLFDVRMDRVVFSQLARVSSARTPSSDVRLTFLDSVRRSAAAYETRLWAWRRIDPNRASRFVNYLSFIFVHVRQLYLETRRNQIIAGRRRAQPFHQTTFNAALPHCSCKRC